MSPAETFCFGGIGILALLAQLIINYDVLRKKTSGKVTLKNVSYRRFLFGTLFYYVTDILWGYFDEMKFVKMLYADTVLYFLAMGLLVMLWTSCTTDYLDEKDLFGKITKGAGQLFFALAPPMIVVNFFTPVLFDISDYDNRDKLLASFDDMIELNRAPELVELAAGMAVFNSGKDSSFSEIFERADRKMYDRKRFLKTVSR